jgi:hypothetical protein
MAVDLPFHEEQVECDEDGVSLDISVGQLATGSLLDKSFLAQKHD